MAEFFIEIGCEEIPAKMIEESLQNGKTLLQKFLDDYEIEMSEIKCFATPTRFIWHIEKIDEREEDKTVKVTGPPKKICFDDKGEPSKALLGFLKKNNVSLEEVKFEEGKTGQIATCSSFIKGKETKDILNTILPQVIKKIQFRKNMKWGNRKEKFVRPIRWICAVFNGAPLNFEFAGVKSGNLTNGHRILGKRNIEVKSFNELKSKLKENFIIIDISERKNLIKQEIESFEKENNAKVVKDDDLLDEMTNLTEYPYVVKGSFDEKFLSIPDEVLITSMKEHQKYFAATDGKGKLLPKFLAIASTNEDKKGYIKLGNERVLAARLYDAKFFWDEDRKKTLISRTETLKRQTFQNDLGTYADKIERMKQIVDILSNHIEFHKTNAIDTVTLCKCDLATDMVYEFPELQGIMGGLYAKEEGKEEDIWKGIYDHYKPTSMEDEVPRTDAGVVTSIADKMDTFLGCLAVGIVPTGSKDPFGLRRASGSIVKIIFEKNLDFDFFKFVEDCLPIYQNLLKIDSNDWKKHIFDIFDARISFLLEKQGFKYDEIDAVMAIPHSKLIDTANRAKALQTTRENTAFQKVAASFKRINNILAKNKTDKEVDSKLFIEQAEHLLMDAYKNLKEELALLITNKDYKKALQKVSEIAETIDKFFDKVLVMDKDEAVKNNRLALLNKLKKQFLKIADFSKLVIK